MIESTTKPGKVNSGPLRLSHLTTGYYVGYCEKASGFSVWCQPEFNPPPGLPVLSRLCSWSIASRADDERSLDASKKITVAYWLFSACVSVDSYAARHP